MKQKIVILIILLLLLPNVNISARPTTSYEAVMTVSGWLNSNSHLPDAFNGHHVNSVDTFVNNSGKTVYYIVNLQPSGFVIVSTDDLIEPIIGFADDGTFDPSFENPLGALVNNDLKSRLSDITKIQSNTNLMSSSGETINTKAQNKWKAYLDSTQVKLSVISFMGLSCSCDIRVTPFIKSQWGQSYVCGLNCYNYYTNFGTSYHYPSGCLATTLAQIMRYFEYPTSGIGELDFNILVNGQEQSATTIGGDGNGGPYNWTQMPLRPNSDCYNLTESQRQAIGAICYDAGLAVNMQYNENGSASYPDAAKYALIDTFGYSNAVWGYNMEDDIITEDLYKMINPSLDAKSPVILGIFNNPDPDSGHAVLCDGYAYDSTTFSGRDGNSFEVSTIYHHLNMGWSGIDDVWYNLPEVDAQRQYNTVTSCLYNIFISQEGEIISGRVLDSKDDPITNAVVYADGPGRTDLHSTLTDHRGIYAFKGLSSDTSYTIWANIDGRETDKQKVQTKLSQDGYTACGNVWGVDFHTDIEPNYIPSAIYYVDNDAPGDPSINNTKLSDPCENGSITSPFDSIQEAIDTASHGDMVIILEGTYTGEGNRDIDFNGKAITVRGEDPNNPNLVIIDCGGTENNPHRGFVFQNFEISKSILSGLTITDGYQSEGGAIYFAGCVRPTITNCIFNSNSAQLGGAIYNDNSNPVISNCTFNKNQSDAGGAIYNYSESSGCTPVLDECIFNNNSCEYNGGAIYNNGKSTPLVTKCTFNSNYSKGGGGAIRNNLGTNLTVANCIFSTNIANTFGGAIRNSNGSNATLTNNTFYANSAINGAAIACTADDEGEYISGSVKILNCIIRDGLYEIYNNDNSTFYITYSNLKDSQSEQAWEGEGNIYADPYFANADAGDFHLKSRAGRYAPGINDWVFDDITSPCIDAGDEESLINNEPTPNGDIINMGAYGGTDEASKSLIFQDN